MTTANPLDKDEHEVSLQLPLLFFHFWSCGCLWKLISAKVESPKSLEFLFLAKLETSQCQLSQHLLLWWKKSKRRTPKVSFSISLEVRLNLIWVKLNFIGTYFVLSSFFIIILRLKVIIAELLFDKFDKKKVLRIDWNLWFLKIKLNASRIFPFRWLGFFFWKKSTKKPETLQCGNIFFLLHRRIEKSSRM